MSCSGHSGVCLRTGGRRARGFCPLPQFFRGKTRASGSRGPDVQVLALSTGSMTSTGVASGPDRQENGDHDEPKRLHVNKFSGMSVMYNWTKAH
jgi:hypothetical protein